MLNGLLYFFSPLFKKKIALILHVWYIKYTKQLPWLNYQVLFSSFECSLGKRSPYVASCPSLGITQIDHANIKLKIAGVTHFETVLSCFSGLLDRV